MNQTIPRKPPQSTQNDDSGEHRLLYDRKGAARQLSISIRSLDYYLNARVFKTRRVGKKTMIPYTELIKFAARDHCERVDRLEAAQK